jgi:tetratricopeptide (TPR) repeat protein
MMDHPNIARVFDAGTTDTGRPFFVMELVKGVPITHYCDQARLNPQERLALFVSVCQAIQHAHQKGIIHRDIKPSNVLVTLVDGAPVPKVIDFGVAKATDRRLTEKTLFTQFGSIVGTLEYMSPEQAELSGMDVDTRSDVYALGVLLYELLTGTTPLEHERLRDAGFAEILRRIREEEPPKPSTRLSVWGEKLGSIAAVRNTEPVRLARVVRGDLDWIVMKAIEKSRMRRYESAGGFARDVERYLDGDAVEASPPSAAYRLRKFGRKYRKAVVVGAAFAGLVVVAAGVSIALAVRATRAERSTLIAYHRAVDAEALATAEGDKARRAAREARAVLKFFQEQVLAAARPAGEEGGMGRNVTVREAVSAAASRVSENFKDQPTVEAYVRAALGVNHLLLGEPGRAAEELERATRLFDAELGSDDPTALEAKNSLAEAYHALGRMPEAIRLHEAALSACEARLGPDGPDTIMFRARLARDFLAVGRTAESIELNERALKASETKFGSDHRTTIAIRANLADAYLSLGRTAEAVGIYEELLKACEAALGDDDSATLSVRASLASAYESSGRIDAAIVLHEATLKARRAKLGPDHPRTLESQISLASAYRAGGRTADAIAVYGQTSEKLDAKLGASHPSALLCRAGLAGAYLSAKKGDQAVKLYEATVLDMEKAFGAGDARTLASRVSLGAAYLAAGQIERAIAHFEATIKAQESKLGPDHPTILTCRSNLAGAYRSAGRTDLAIALYEATIKAQESKLGHDHPATLGSRNGLAVTYKAAGRVSDAIKLYEQTLVTLASKLGPDHPETVAVRNNLAIAYKSVGRADSDIELSKATLRAIESKLGPTDAETVAARDKLIDLYQSIGRTGDAIKLLEITESNLGSDTALSRKARLGLMRRYYQMGLFDRALPHYLRQYQAALGEHGPRHIDTLIAMRDLAEVYARLGRFDEAEPLFLASLEGLTDRPKNDPIVLLTEGYLANMYEVQGRHAEAEPLRSASLEAARAQFGPGNPGTAGPLAQLGLNLLGQRLWSEAEPILRECLALREKAQPDDWATFHTRSMLGESLAGQGKFAEAEPLVISGYDGLIARASRIPDGAKARLLAAGDRGVRLYAAWGKKETEQQWRKKVGMRYRPATPCVP